MAGTSPPPRSTSNAPASDGRRASTAPSSVCSRTLRDGDGGVEPSSVQRHALAESAVEIAISRLLGYRVAWMQSKSLVPNYEASMGKAFGSELSQRNACRGINVLGLAGQLRPQSDHTVMNGLFCQLYMSTVSATIAAGTSEIQRNIIATRGLGLPRG